MDQCGKVRRFTPGDLVCLTPMIAGQGVGVAGPGEGVEGGQSLRGIDLYPGFYIACFQKPVT